MERFKGTKGEWHAVDYAGYIHIQDEPFYGGVDLLNQETCSEAQYNAQLAASAPDLLKACETAILELQLIPCKCDPKVIDELERAIKKALNIK